MRTSNRLRLAAVVAGVAWLSAGLGTGGCSLFQSEHVSKGQALYNHYCVHCHGEHGRQNEGFNWSYMSDPKPKDLSNKEEMGTFKDEEIFNTISRDMKDTGPNGDKIGEDEFAVPTMPTFKYTLSEEDIWSIVAFVRTLHGMKLEFNIEGRKKELQDAVQAAEQKYKGATQAADEAEKKANEEAEKKGVEVDDAAYAKEQAAMGQAKKELDKAQAELANFTTRPGRGASVVKPDLTVKPEAETQLAELGKRLYVDKYGCNGCHAIGDEGGKVGPALDRAGFRLNAAWVYRWMKNPQAMKPTTRMPALGLSDGDAKAISFYLRTLRAPKSEKSVEKVEG
jgi:mono/diheme cytochrome c family protein